MKVFAFLLLITFSVSCNETKTPEPAEVKPAPKVEKNYSFGKLYRDSINKYRLQYPENWEIVSGEAKHTAIKFINRDSSMSLSVNVMPDDGQISYYDLSENKLQDYKTKFSEALTSANKPPIDMTVDKGFLDSQNAIISSYKFVYRQIDVELLFQFYQIQASKEGNIYTITLSLPDKYYSKEFKTYINNFLYSFRFDPE